MRRSTSGKTCHTRSKLLLGLIVLVSLTLFMVAQVAYAADDYQYGSEFGTNGTGDGQFNNPYDVKLDSSGNIYVADYSNNRIQKLDKNGNFLAKWGKNGGDGTSGTGDGQFIQPCGLAIDSNGNVYVADTYNHRIQKFDSSGNFLAKWGKNGGDGTSGTGDGQFNWPTNVAIDSSNNIYVADYANNRIQKFDVNGNFLAKWGTLGTGDGQFKYARGITVDKDNKIYVADLDNHRIQKFDSSGTFISKFGTSGTGDGQFNNPYGMTTDSNGDVYVADGGNHRIQKFSSSGTFITKFGTSGIGDGQFQSPHGVAVDSSGNVYIADTNNHRIQKFTKSDASLVAADKAWLTFDRIKKSNSAETNITSNLDLLTAGSNGSVIFWTSNNASVIGADGKVTRPDSDKSDAGVILTATITKGTVADTKTFNLTVKASESAPVTTTTASTFTDVPSGAWYKSYVDTLIGKGIIAGYADNTFRPGTSVTRAEFSKMLSLAMGWATPIPTTASFTDVAVDNWAAPYIEAAKSHNALSGYPGGTFDPTKAITRAEIATIIAKVKGLASTPAAFTDTNGHWANGSIGACANAGILAGYTGGIFKPDGPANRAEAAKLIAALI